MSRKEKAEAVVRLKELCSAHDALEREILVVCRKFTDEELRSMGMAEGG